MRSSSAAACSPSKPHHLGLRERLEREPGERRAPPLRERGAQATRGALGQPRGERPPALVAQTPRSAPGPAPQARRSSR